MIFLALYNAGINVKASHVKVIMEIRAKFLSQLRSITFNAIKNMSEITTVTMRINIAA